jgi:hypothetical protein
MSSDKQEDNCIVRFTPRHKTLTQNEKAFVDFILEKNPMVNTMDYVAKDVEGMSKMLNKNIVKSGTTANQQDFFKKVIAEIKKNKDVPLYKVFKEIDDTTDPTKDQLIFGGVFCDFQDDLDASKDIDFLSDLLDSWDFSVIFAYDGFNPVNGRQQVLNLVKTLDETDQGRPGSKHLISLISVVCMRGTNEKMDKRMSSAGVAAIKDAMTLLQISRESGKSMGQTFINLSRLSSCFPDIVSKFYLSNANFVHIKCPSPILPMRYTHPSAACMIPLARPALFKIWCRWAKSFSTLIGAKNKRQKRFWKIIYESKMFGEDQRVSFYEAAMKEQVMRVLQSRSDIKGKFFTAQIVASTKQKDEVADYSKMIITDKDGNDVYDIDSNIKSSDSEDSSDSSDDEEDEKIEVARGSKSRKNKKKNKKKSSKKEREEAEGEA